MSRWIAFIEYIPNKQSRHKYIKNNKEEENNAESKKRRKRQLY